MTVTDGCNTVDILSSFDVHCHSTFLRVKCFCSSTSSFVRIFSFSRWSKYLIHVPFGRRHSRTGTFSWPICEETHNCRSSAGECVTQGFTSGALTALGVDPVKIGVLGGVSRDSYCSLMFILAHNLNCGPENDPDVFLKVLINLLFFRSSLFYRGLITLLTFSLLSFLLPWVPELSSISNPSAVTNVYSSPHLFCTAFLM